MIETFRDSVDRHMLVFMSLPELDCGAGDFSWKDVVWTKFIHVEGIELWSLLFYKDAPHRFLTDIIGNDVDSDDDDEEPA